MLEGCPTPDRKLWNIISVDLVYSASNRGAPTMCRMQSSDDIVQQLRRCQAKVLTYLTLSCWRDAAYSDASCSLWRSKPSQFAKSDDDWLLLARAGCNATTSAVDCRFCLKDVESVSLATVWNLYKENQLHPGLSPGAVYNACHAIGQVTH